jgi:hypothetical protein
MKAIIISLLFVSFTFYAQSQERKFLSNSGSKSKTEFEPIVQDRTITISDKQFKIPNILSDGKEDLILNIESKIEKEYFFEKSVWYYCKSQKGTNYIVILPKMDNICKMNVFHVYDEVTIFRSEFRLQSI